MLWLLQIDFSIHLAKLLDLTKLILLHESYFLGLFLHLKHSFSLVNFIRFLILIVSVLQVNLECWNPSVGIAIPFTNPKNSFLNWMSVPHVCWFCRLCSHFNTASYNCLVTVITYPWQICMLSINRGECGQNVSVRLLMSTSVWRLDAVWEMSEWKYG